ncbi:MAG TPA: cupredoxin family copper-binding protein [Pseudonocardiaceae bacterium]
MLAVLAVAIPSLALPGFASAAAGPPPAAHAVSAHAVSAHTVKAAQTMKVTISNFAFDPADLTVHAGDTVTWVNEDEAPHDITTTNAPAAIESGTLMKGQSYRYTFSAPGSYSYKCSLHPDMVATVTAMEHAPAPAAEAPPAPEAPPAGDGPAAPAPAVAPAAGPLPAAPVAGAPAAPGPVPAAVAPQPAPVSTQAGGTQQGKTLDPLLIIAGIALGVATLCLLLVSGQRSGSH